MSRTRKAAFFENDDVAHDVRPLPFSVFREPESRIAVPLLLSPIPERTNIGEAVTGSVLLGLPLKQQGKEIAAVLQATKPDGRPLYRRVVIEMSRRSQKTTAIWETLIGRCVHRPGYKVVTTAQNGTMARKKMVEILKLLLASDFEGTKHGSARIGSLYFGQGSERIEFDNGSMIWVVPPDPGSFRSEAADVALIDEGGELPVEKADALLAGALPIMDTRPNAQVIVAGTPNVEQRAGILWDFRTTLIAGKSPNYGGVIYAATDRDIFADLTDVDNPVYDLELLKRVHPGISSGLTDVETVMENLGPMGLRKFEGEYLCKWPLSASNTALDVQAWRDCESQDPMPERPERIGLAFEVDKLGQKGALVAAWRDERGRAVFELIDFDNGTDWLPGVAKKAQDKHRVAVSYDSIGSNIEVAERMIRSPYRVRLLPFKLSDNIGAVARLEKEIAKRNVVHYGQAPLTDAIEAVVWRPAGKDGRLFMRGVGEAAAVSPAPAVAAAEALWAYDRATPAPGTGQRRVRTAEAIRAERAARARQGAVA